MNYKALGISILFIFLIGIVSADTVVIYPTSDGAELRTTSTQTWANIRSGVGTAEDQTTPGIYVRSHSSTSARYVELDRFGMSYNLSTVPAGATITYVNLSLWGRSKENGFSTTLAGVIGNTTPTNWESWALTDYNKTATPYFGNYTYAAWTTAQYNNASLNANGVAEFQRNIGGHASIMYRSSWDYDGVAPTWGADKVANMGTYSIDEAGTSHDPFVTITYTPAAEGSPPVSSYTLQKTFIRIPGLLQANDTSTNTPTLWNWSWGDGTWTNGTTQNATHTYTTRGKFSTLLLTSNAYGSNITPSAQTLRIVGYENC
jgi:PKD repeat protein